MLKSDAYKKSQVWICMALAVVLVFGCRKKPRDNKFEEPKEKVVSIKQHSQQDPSTSEQGDRRKEDRPVRLPPSKRKDWRAGHFTTGKAMVSSILNHFPRKEEIPTQGEFETSAEYEERKRSRDKTYEQKLKEFRVEWVGREIEFSSTAIISGQFDADKLVYRRIYAKTPGLFSTWPDHGFSCEPVFLGEFGDRLRRKVTASYSRVGFYVNIYNARMTLEQAKLVRQLSNNDQLYIKVKFRIRALIPAHENTWYDNKVTFEIAEVTLVADNGEVIWEIW